MKQSQLAGISFLGGKKEGYFITVFKYHPENQRWSLDKIISAKNENYLPKDDLLLKVIKDYKLDSIVVDFPLSNPYCIDCTLDCPGILKCSHNEVKLINNLINNLLTEDYKISSDNPKAYETKRVKDKEFDFKKDIFSKKVDSHQLSKGFKKKLKKGYSPYWNRAIDLYIWFNYYDYLLELFNYSFDSFGNVPVKLLHHFHYLKKHFERNINFYESNIYIILTELFQNQVITKKNIYDLNSLETSSYGRIKVLKACEKYFNLFIYEKDLEFLSKHPKAFESFLLSLTSLNIKDSVVKDLPDFVKKANPDFLLPDFSNYRVINT